VTEAEWLACRTPKSMLDWLVERSGEERLHSYTRKLRLWACACVRRCWELLGDESGRKAVVVAERFADGLADEQELDAARATVEAAVQTMPAGPPGHWARYYSRETPASLVSRGMHPEAMWAAGEAGNLAGYYAGNPDVPHPVAAPEATAARFTEAAAHCALLREVIGNPFRPVRPNPSWLSWNDGVAVKLARVIYEERRFADLPILADALEDAGCTDADILGHCRSGGEHVRGCWVVDLLLGKE
jgi:hypothetical protein